MEGLSSISTGYALGKGRHTFRFGIDFPMVATCFQLQPQLQHAERTLPPSFSVCTSELRTRATYILRAKVKRPRIYQRQRVAEEEVIFIPLDPPTTTSQPATLCCQKCTQAIPGEVLGFCDNLVSIPGTLPRYSPALFLEGVILSPATLYPGSRLPLELYVTTSTSLLEGLNNMIWLRSLDIRLRSKTTVQIGCHTNIAIAEVPIKRIETKLLLQPAPETETFRIDDQLWKECKIPQVIPSFSSCIIRQEHMVEVIAGFSSDIERKIKVRPLPGSFRHTNC